MRKPREPEMIPVMFLGSLSQQGAGKRLDLEKNRGRLLPHFNQSPTFPIIPITSRHFRKQEAASVAEPGPADSGGPAARTCANANSDYCRVSSWTTRASSFPTNAKPDPSGSVTCV